MVLVKFASRSAIDEGLSKREKHIIVIFLPTFNDLKAAHKRGFAPGACSRLILHVSVHMRERFQVRSICPGSLLPNI